MVTSFYTPIGAKAARLALILLCLGLAAPGQTASKGTTAGTASKTAKKSGSAAPAKDPGAVIHTTAGDMRCELFPSQAPKAVANFIGLARGTKAWKDPVTGKEMHKPLYDGVIFHRVIPEFMIQTGDPTGTGSGSVGFEFPDELHADLLFDQPGRLAMANHGVNTNGSQFFITEKEVPFLNPCLEPAGCMGGRRAPNSGYTIFGQCDAETVELVKKIARMACQAGPVCSDANSRPATPVKITHIEIVSAGKGAPAPKKPSPSPSKPGTAPAKPPAK